VLPFRDVHLISILHLKRFIIWSLLVYALFRQFTTRRIHFSNRLLTFTKVAGFFVAMIVVALIQTASELYVTNAITPTMLKASILSDALAIVEGLLIVYLIYYLVENMAQLQVVFYGMLITSVIISLLGIGQYLVKGPISGLEFLFDQELQFYGRTTSVFSNPNEFGGYMTPMVITSLVMLIVGMIPLRKKLFIILPVFLLNSASLLLSFSRGAILQGFLALIPIGVLYYMYLSKKRFSWKLAVLGVLVSLCLLAVPQLYDLYMRARLATYGEHEYQRAMLLTKTVNDFQRKHNLVKGLEAFSKHPLFGVGYNLFSGKKIAGFEYFGSSPHNQYAKILVEMGLLGFLPFLALFGVLINVGRTLLLRFQKHQSSREIASLVLVLLSGMSTVIFGYLFTDSLNFLPISGTLWLFGGATLVLDRFEQERSVKV
jgi:O-antigen ligase